MTRNTWMPIFVFLPWIFFGGCNGEKSESSQPLISEILQMINDSTDADNDADDDSFHAAPAGYLQDMRYNPEVLATQSDQDDLRQTQLSSALTSLDARSRDIIQRRWLDEKKPTLHELADEYGISAERIRQIESKALDVMKDALEA